MNVVNIGLEQYTLVFECAQCHVQTPANGAKTPSTPWVSLWVMDEDGGGEMKHHFCCQSHMEEYLKS